MKRFIILLSLVFITQIQAQELKILQGNNEFSGSAAVNQGAFGGELKMGTFLLDHLLLGGKADYYDSDYYVRYSAGVYMNYLFETGSYWIPYVGAGLDLGALEPVFLEKETGVEFELYFGLKYFLAPNVSLNTELKLGYSSANTYLESNEYTDTEYHLGVGLSYYW
jgi:hypothetical protein